MADLTENNNIQDLEVKTDISKSRGFKRKHFLKLYINSYVNLGQFIFYFSLGFVLALFDGSFNFYEFTSRSLLSNISNAVNPLSAFILVFIFSFAVILLHIVIRLIRDLLTRSYDSPFRYPLSESISIAVKIQIITFGLMVGLIIVWFLLPEAQTQSLGWYFYFQAIWGIILFNLYFIVPSVFIYLFDLISTNTLLSHQKSFVVHYPKLVCLLLAIILLFISMGIFYLRVQISL